MKEKELRLSLVCYGGVSLAVYMHGVVDEVLKITRASKVIHQQKQPAPGHGAGLAYRADDGTSGGDYDRCHPNPPYETDTERLYFELLQAFFPKVELRVVVDAISGASAGGINGIFLARALAHDLSLSPQRKMWIDLADVLKLMDEQTIASRWSKFYLYPALLVLGWKRLRKYFPSREMRRKASIFLRSRWLEPPFSGDVMLGWMLDAAHAMGKAGRKQTGGVAHPCRSLMPAGQRLELMVSLTNFFGKQQTVTLNDPPEVSEREHRTTLLYKYFRHENGVVESDFTDDNIPGLAFAARATSSFPGAFLPASLADVTALLEKRGEGWPAKAAFMARNQQQFQGNAAAAASIYFIDGSVVNNKPFGEVIAALQERPAHREVDRRIIYIDPSPDKIPAADKQEKIAMATESAPAPGFFHTIFDAVVQIPGNEPIRDELQKVNAHNRRARRLQSVLKSLKVDIEPYLDEIITPESARTLSTPLLVSWREKINREAAAKAGYAYLSYLHLKLYYLFDSVSDCLSKATATGTGAASSVHLSTRQAILSWARDKKIWVADKEDIGGLDQLAAIQVLRGLDIDFRVRRLRFLIKAINEAYHAFGNNGNNAQDLSCLNALKKAAYYFISDLKSCWQLQLPAVTIATSRKPGHISQLAGKLVDAWDLEEKDLAFDDQFCALLGEMDSQSLRLDIVRSYIGFPFYDVLTLPLLQTTDLTEIDTISVNRISPQDRSSIPWPEGGAMLQGTSFGNFGAFFQRSARENDHIWGRLQASERLVDFVINSAEAQNLPENFDVKDFKKRLFLTILASEKPHIKTGHADFDRIKSLVDAL